MRTAAISTLLLLCLVSVAMFFVYLDKGHRGTYRDYSLTLPALTGSDSEFNLEQIRTNGRAFVLNVFSSWCSTCLEEHVTWKSIAQESSVDIYGIAYVDVEESTLSWLEKHGNPYKIVAADYSGQVAKVLGVTGIPETFVFNKKGGLVLHITGVVTPVWKKRITQLLS